MITNKFILFLVSLRPRLLERQLVNGEYWKVKVFWLGKVRVFKVKDIRVW